MTPDQIAKTYADVDKLKALEAQGLSGSIYTQPYDVEQEQNGLMTYDRAVLKIPVAEIAGFNSNWSRGQELRCSHEGFSALTMRMRLLKHNAMRRCWRVSATETKIYRSFGI